MKINFDLWAKCLSKSDILAFRKTLQQVPFEEYYIHFFPKFTEVLKAANLFKQASPSAYEEHRAQACRRLKTVHFASRSGSHHLVIPCKAYPHIAVFTQQASQAEFVALIRQLRTQLKRMAGKNVHHIFTHGHEVAWLHVKIPIRNE